MLNRRTAAWGRLAAFYAMGVLAAAQLGKLAALAPTMGQALGLSLLTLASAIALLEVAGATLASGASALALRLGLARTARCSLALLALAGAGSASSQGAVSLLAWRLLESLGYLGVVVSAPVLLAAQAAGLGPRVQGVALAVWSSFVPVGVALGSWGAAAMAQGLGWRAALLAWAGLLALAALGAWRMRLEPESGPSDDALPRPPGLPDAGGHRQEAKLSTFRSAKRLALGFGCFTLFEVGQLALLPTLLVTRAGLSASTAAQITGACSLITVLGSALAAWQLRQARVGQELALRASLLGSLALPGLLIFGVFNDRPQLATALVLALAMNISLGVFGSLAFALMPAVAVTPQALTRAYGWLAQCGAAGALAGPPFMALCVDHAGWLGAAAGGAAGLALGVRFMHQATSQLGRPAARPWAEG
jgi:MFS family permease